MPKRMALVTIDLVECFFDFQPTPLQFNLHKGKAIDEQRDIIPVFIPALDGDLLRDLILILAPVFLIDKLYPDIFSIFFSELETVAQSF